MQSFEELRSIYRYTKRFSEFHNLMHYRVREILLVSSLYDSFIFEQDGQLNELLLSEFLDHNLFFQAPVITRASSGKEALALIRDKKRFDLIITTMHLPDMHAHIFAGKVARRKDRIPVILLAYDNRELKDLLDHYDVSKFERIFIWQGDFRLVLAIIKYIEDRMNVAHDTRTIGVHSIIVIEDNIRFYSSFLPILYSELMKHSQSLISEGLNLPHKILRMRTRPKILLCGSFEEARHFFATYRAQILGVISDIEFPHGNKIDPQAGAKFAQLVMGTDPDIPVLLQTSSQKHAALAESLGVSFLLKTSPTLLKELRQFVLEKLGFGSFVFRLPDGTEVDRADDLQSLEKKLHTVPEESIKYHGERNHFSKWLKARTEFLLAEKLKPRKVSDYATLEDLRLDLTASLREFRAEQNREVVEDFDRKTFDEVHTFARIGSGSLGGKARGLAFVRTMINEYHIRDHFKDILISVPPLVVLGTDIFDQFLDENNLRDFAIHAGDDREIRERFLAANFPEEIREDLRSFLNLIDYPLAVRSSSLFEDSQYQPFTGVYETLLIPNHHPRPDIRLEELLFAIKRVFASTFSQHAKNYMQATPYRLEEEKMAVIVQKLVGQMHENRFYPDFSGVAKSHNFYPLPPMGPKDGIVAAALGLGETVVEGETVLYFCPKYPRNIIQLSTTPDFLQTTQRGFYALTIDDRMSVVDSDRADMKLKKFGLEVAERDGTLALVGSTYSPENNAVYDGLSRPGIRLVSFAPILKHGLFPLPEILKLVLDMGSWGMSAPVEIEFAVTMSTPPGTPKEFSFLQIRPLVLKREAEELDTKNIAPQNLICRSARVFGNGKIDDIRDIIVVDIHRFKRSESRITAQEVEAFNRKLTARGTPYLLIGLGRWGSADPWLGIPVAWDQISGARTIVETGFKHFEVTPSQGSHFFHNLTSFMIGYFTVNPHLDQGFVDWDWLTAQEAVEEKAHTRHLQFKDPVIVKMSGRKNEGIILKPGCEK